MDDKKSGALALWGNGTKPAASARPPSNGFLNRPSPATMFAPLRPIEPARLVFGVDATGSRAAAWETATKLQDSLVSAVPGELEVALAVHGGSRLHTFTDFTSDVRPLRWIARGIRCQAGYTRLVDILRRSLVSGNVKVIVYIGDVFEESEAEALSLGKLLAAKATRVIVLHDIGAVLNNCASIDQGDIFHALAEMTGGAVLPFNAAALEPLGQMLEAVSVLAVGGIELVQARRESMPGAPLLLEYMGGNKRLARK